MGQYRHMPSSFNFVHKRLAIRREMLRKGCMDEFCKGRLACIKAIIGDGSNRISREEERIIQAGRDIVEIHLVYGDVWLAGLSLSPGDGHLHPRLTREWEK